MKFIPRVMPVIDFFYPYGSGLFSPMIHSPSTGHKDSPKRFNKSENNEHNMPKIEIKTLPSNTYVGRNVGSTHFSMFTVELQFSFIDIRCHVPA